MARLSVVTAFLNEEENLPAFRRRLQAALAGLGMDYQVVLVDDHSRDGGPAFARQWAAEDAAVCYLRLSRNSGPHAAFSAGLAHADGDAVVLLSADLQDPPETIAELVARWRAGHDVVWACRAERGGDGPLTKLCASAYYALMRRYALPDMPRRGADFLLMDRKVVRAYNAIPEKNTSFLAMILWMGFRQTSIRYDRQPRHAGRSKWTFARKVKLFLDSLLSFSYAPVRLMSLAGGLIGLLGLGYAALLVVNCLAGRGAEGWCLVLLALLLIGGFQLVMMGVLGEYLWRTYDESRGRPRYLIEEGPGAAPAEAPRREAA
jgi:dolichol-phosphate mannosyltransferase